MSKLFKINDKDNVAVALEELKKGEIIDNIKLLDDISFGHKVLLNDLKSGENIIKYGNPIGHLTIDCKKGEHIHEHNLKTNLSDIIEYKYCGENEYHPKKCDVTFNGYLRQDGRAATRNEIWIIPTVGCVNNTAKRLEKIGQDIIGGGSDAFSGITANALCGRLTDKLTSFGTSAILTEVPEMFGAEKLLMKRCENEKVFNKCVNMINSFKHYFFSHNQECYENPSPGNHDGGITTLEEKSLGCIQKGGKAVITDVLEYGEHCKKQGLNLLTGPGNDIVSTTNLTAAGANIILFTTGRGTPLGASVPTIKVSSNSRLAKRKSNWIDFNAGELIKSNDFENMTEEIFKLLIDIASGRQTKNEQNGYRDISIFKDGVIM